MSVLFPDVVLVFRPTDNYIYIPATIFYFYTRVYPYISIPDSVMRFVVCAFVVISKSSFGPVDILFGGFFRN